MATLLQELLLDYGSLPEYSGIEPVDVNQISLFGDRPMHVAAVRGSIQEMEVLVSAGANIHTPGEHGFTPLHCAVEQGKVDAAIWLLEHGADKTVVNHRGMTPRDLAKSLNEDALFELLG